MSFYLKTAAGILLPISAYIVVAIWFPEYSHLAIVAGVGILLVLAAMGRMEFTTCRKHALRAGELMLQGLHEEADTELSHARRSANRAWVYRNLGQSLVEATQSDLDFCRHRFEDSEKAARKALAFSKRTAQTGALKYLRGRALLAMGRVEEGLQELEESASTAPVDMRAHALASAGAGAFDARRPLEAERLLEKAEEAARKLPSADEVLARIGIRWTKGLIAFARGDFEQSSSLIEAALQDREEAGLAIDQGMKATLAAVMTKAHRYKQAEDVARQVMADSKGRPMPFERNFGHGLTNLAEALLKQNRIEEASTAIDEAMPIMRAQGGAFAGAVLSLKAEILAAQQNYREADHYYVLAEEQIRSERQFTDALDEILDQHAVLCELLLDPERAETLRREAASIREEDARLWQAVG